MIEINGVTKSYNGKTNAVDDINLKINDGEILGFLGPNGAGKTTTIKMITGIISPTKGTILINGVDLKEEPVRYKKKLGYVPDNPDMFLRMKGIEYLNFMADMYEVPIKERSDKIYELSKKFSMENSLGDKLQSYSHGMRQKIVLIGALLHNPEVWILDEPMTGLDPKSSFVLKEMMKNHAKAGNSVFFSTHVLEVAEKLCDRVAIINKGKILYCGTLDEMKHKFAEDEPLEKMFLEMTGNE